MMHNMVKFIKSEAGWCLDGILSGIPMNSSWSSVKEERQDINKDIPVDE